MVTKFSFRQNLRGVSNQKTYLTKVIKEYAHMMEIPCRPLNIVSIDDNKFILSQSSFNGKGSDVSSLARFFTINLIFIFLIKIICKPHFDLHF